MCGYTKEGLSKRRVPPFLPLELLAVYSRPCAFGNAARPFELRKQAKKKEVEKSFYDPLKTNIPLCCDGYQDWDFLERNGMWAYSPQNSHLSSSLTSLFWKDSFNYVKRILLVKNYIDGYICIFSFYLKCNSCTCIDASFSSIGNRKCNLHLKVNEKTFFSCAVSVRSCNNRPSRPVPLTQQHSFLVYLTCCLNACLGADGGSRIGFENSQLPPHLSCGVSSTL